MLRVTRVVARRDLLVRKAMATMQKAVVMVQELEHASIGVNLMDASRVINAPMPMSGTISTTKRRDVGSVPVWNIAKDCTAGDKVMTSPGDRSSKGSPKGKGKTKDGKNDKGKGKDRDKPVGGVDQSSKDSQPQVAQVQQQPQVAQIQQQPQVAQIQQQPQVAPTQQQPQVAQVQQQPQVAQVQQQVQPSVMGEVASLLKTMRTTSTTPRVLAVVTDSNQGVLLDSGATHILRGPYDETEWMQAIPTEVQTATGKTQLRMSKMSRSLLTKDDLQPIVPLGMLTQHGCKMRWHRDGGVK